MVQLKQITRNATFAWSPAKTGKAMIASGTIAGAVDASFSQDSELEFWDIDVDNTDSSAFELSQPAARVSIETKFYSLAWGYVTPEKPHGVIAGAMDDGHLNIWDVNSIFQNPASSLITSNQTRGTVKVVEFNPVTPKLLISAGTGGEFNIWDLDHPSQPYPAPGRGPRVNDIDAASWNRKVANILATASTNGFTSIWDLKQSREILHLKAPGRQPVSAIAWDPDNSTRLITGSGDDAVPSLYVWDLRNTNAPAQTLEGHSAGVLSLSWCHLDHDLLLSCGKDNRTILWNPQVGKILGEFPIASTWAFETQWCPQNPDLLANATFEGKIIVHRLQSALSKSKANGTQAGGEDFFSQRQYVSEGGFELKQAPSWLRVPCSASFGFGGSLVSVKNTPSGKGEVKVMKYMSEPKISENASEFEKATHSADWNAFCSRQIDNAPTATERENWRLLKLLFDSEPRKRLIEYLGIERPEFDTLTTEKASTTALEKTDSEVTAAASSDEPVGSLADNALKNNRLSGIFGGVGDFLEQLNTSASEAQSHPPSSSFSIISHSDSESDKLITKALLFGDFEHAVDMCLKEDRLSDALIFAALGDQALQQKARNAYFSHTINRSNYLRLLRSVVDSNLFDVAEHAGLDGWKHILVAFCTFAKTDSEYSDLCEILGRRLEREDKVEEAKVCYLAGKKFDPVVKVWVAEAEKQEMDEALTAQNNSAFSIHARALQGFVEKVTVFKQTKGAISSQDPRLLFDKYTEFVEIVASQGNLSVAQKYVDLVEGENEALKAIKKRLSMALATPKPATTSTKRETSLRAPQPGFHGQPSIPPVSSQYPVPPRQAFPYPAPQSTAAAAPGPAPPLKTAPSPYNPASPASTSVPQYAPKMYTPYNPGLQPPNAQLSRVADLPPPPKRTTENWNDPPMLSNPARTRTPITPLPNPPSPFTGTSPPPAHGLQKPSPGPPPTSAKPPQRVKSVSSSPPFNSAQLTSAPPQGNFTHTPPAGTPVGQPPPSFPRTNNFTPPPPPRASQPLSAVPAEQFGGQSSVSQSGHQYAPSPLHQNSKVRTSSPSLSPPPGQVPSRYAPPAQAQQTPEAISTPELPGVPAKVPTPHSKYAPGDRSHIPDTSRPVYEAFSNEINRIKQLGQTPQQKRIIGDVDKRLNILFDLLNNEAIPAGIVSELVKLAQALSRRQFDVASQIQVEVHTANEQYSTWMLGIKRLIDMARALT